eukprot:3966887-Amphidinium_carterae.1
MFGLDTLGPLRNTDLSLMISRYASLLRKAIGLRYKGEHTPRFSNEQVRFIAKAPSVLALLDQARVRWFLRQVVLEIPVVRVFSLLADGPESTWRALDHSAGRISHLEAWSGLPSPPSRHKGTLIEAAVGNRECWQKCLKKYVASTVLTCWPTSEEVAKPEKELLECILCEKECRGVQGLTAHMRAAHGVNSGAVSKTSTTRCPVCGGNFGTRARVLQHIARTS